MQAILFSKIAGTGNDFLIIDNRRDVVPDADKSWFARAVCDRRRSVGADGVLFLERSAQCNFTMRLFNPDGLEGEMCGNGARSIAYYAHVKGIAPREMRFDTLAGVVDGAITDLGVKVRLWRLDAVLPERRELEVAGNLLEAHYIQVGVPHVVIFQQGVDRAVDATIDRLGREIRFHPAFPNGTNVNFVSVTGIHDLTIRTYERGVEAETLACGTGSVAASLAAHQLFGVESPVRLKTRGGLIQVTFAQSPSGWDIFLEGEVRHIMDGVIMPGAWTWKEAGQT
ncbi:MAG TPA: diaminopimelate epimerase [Symbiobacteriaceae bacterium]|nr:diaminopimelate epimerase [Symbiobacteriaceae bacterium]